MSSILVFPRLVLGFLKRLWTDAHPPQPAKSANALRIGLLGASWIAPAAIIIPAKSHPEVIIAAVAARDHAKGKAYAKKHGIPIVHTSYQDLIDDHSVDSIYIPLPNGLHYEWALKSLRAGKNVLLEKPSVSNAVEASSLFNFHASLSQNKTKAPILLEAFHTLFHPAFQLFLSHLDHENVIEAKAQLRVMSTMFPWDDIRFNYELAGGSMMDLGGYTIIVLRSIFGTEPVECVSAEPTLLPHGYDRKVDKAMRASWRFPNGGVGSLEVDLKAKGYPQLGRWLSKLVGWVPTVDWPGKAVAIHREAVVPDSKIGEGQEHVVVKTVTMYNFLAPGIWHRISIVEDHSIREKKDKKVVKTWTEKKSVKAYKEFHSDSGNVNVNGEEWWSTYRYQLEAFVDRVKGREGTGVWMEGEDSVKQMEMIDSAYTKASLPLRPTSELVK